jgi:xanthine dehydrogenase small subunit
VPGYYAAVAGRLATLPATPAQAAPAEAAAALVVAGGTDLYVQRNAELPGRELQLLSRRPGFSGVWPAEGSVAIGAATTVSAMMAAPVLNAALPGLAGCLRRVSSAAIRNRATLGGNIANASPIGDLSVMFLALDARVGLRGAAGNREMALRDFFLGYKKLAMQKDEVLAWVSVPLSKNGMALHFEKVARRRNQDIASVNSALGLETEGGRIAVAHVAAGGVAPVPLYLGAASAFLAGKEVSARLVRDMAAVADSEIAPISDVRGAASYKRSLLRRLLFAHFLELFPERVAAGELL